MLMWLLSADLFDVFSWMLSDWSSHVPADARCKTNAKADIILLVDGSWSIGRLNFKTIRNFISRTVSVFDISPERVQIGNHLSALPSTPINGWTILKPWVKWRFLSSKIFVSAGLAQYSGDPKTEWHLNAHPNRESLLKAVANLPYKGGNTMTGDRRVAKPVATRPLMGLPPTRFYYFKKSKFYARICWMLTWLFCSQLLCFPLAMTVLIIRGAKL